MSSVRELLKEEGRFPCRRTFQRRLKALPGTLPEQIGCLGRHLVELLRPWEKTGRAVALDSTPLRAKGGVWHKKDKEAGRVPHTSIDTEAGWTKSGWHGWVYGWKLHLATTVAGVWIPLAAWLTPANEADSQLAPKLLQELPEEARASFWVIPTTTPPRYASCARAKSSASWWLGGTGERTRTRTQGWRSGAFSTS